MQFPIHNLSIQILKRISQPIYLLFSVSGKLKLPQTINNISIADLTQSRSSPPPVSQIQFKKLQITVVVIASLSLENLISIPYWNSSTLEKGE